uniref:lipid phosphate phosphatase epsilon 1, chloroplastic-like n=1 Tax=Erigeron canadensis TaxID=72917 RepID=UPI001CB8D85B|nr:lipid phosphate phosphatase epsilon 1, chloroplastic-like [Erigeron canadensis]
MSPASTAILLNSPPISDQFHNFRIIHRNTKSPFYTSLKKSKIVYKKNSVRIKKLMAAESLEMGFGDESISPLEQEALIDNSNNNGGVSFHQTVGGLHVLLNKLSKWVVAVTFGGLILVRHDVLALWAAMGSVLNVMLSVALKKILKQERPVSGGTSGHGMPSSKDRYGMPSSHAQSIFFTLVFWIISVVKWHGLNGVTASFGLLFVALGSYFSWLRSYLRYHSTSQVIVGAVVGSSFSLLWLWAWEAIVHTTYNSNLWARILVLVGATISCVGFFLHIIQHWIKGED